MGNDGIYSVGQEIMNQICQNSKIECFAGILWEDLICEILVKTNCHIRFKNRIGPVGSIGNLTLIRFGY